ncbi:methyltransferase [Amycolatopsis jiangsuensis]|uniref:tRNA1(Val) A37 N6-methylase TrmN6 n=1 Tax=Amycolatopsis jiangsuensis TaxID=1181879 RepID=A0A840J0A8_9PSEU|nr:class I SAM-dependent methyltransferase [Amycolatopsis jiangsuensis]MBB4687510.1 tRNA1(Val) A37 N6-methylase TrmN6 [Amycolatopsis jiangsuensis]
MSTITWTENETPRSARWHSENSAPAPENVVVADDRITANTAQRLARSGTGLLWRGDFPNARQLLRAMARRLRQPAGGHRAAQAERAGLLGKLLVLLEPDHSLRLRRAPDVRAACDHAYGPANGATVVSLSELLGVLGAHQWHLRGVEIPALNARIHPDYGVFSPTRGDYVDLVARAPLPAGAAVAFDLGTGTGVLAAVLARRGVRVMGTDVNPRAVACARTNLTRLGLAGQVRVVETSRWPSGRADLVVCNPPWLPGRPASPVELGVYDAGSGMLHQFLDGLADHLTANGEGWLVLSDLAEHLGLRTRAELLGRIRAAGLRVAARADLAPRPARAMDQVTSLWRLRTL